MTSKNLSVILPLFLIIIIDAMGLSLVLPVVTSLMLSAHSSLLPHDFSSLIRNILYGGTLMLYPLGMFFGAPILGDLSDRYGRKSILLICLLGAALGYVISGIGVAVNSLLLLFVGRFTCGLMASSQPIAQATIADITTGKQRTIMMSFIILAVALGVVFGPMIGGSLSNLPLLHDMNYIAPFGVAMILALINAAWLKYGFHETFFPKHENKIQITKGFRMFIHAFRSSNIKNLSIVFLCFMVSWSLYFQNLPLYLTKAFGYSSLQVGMFISFMGIGFSIALGILTRVFVKFLNTKQIAMIGLSVTSVSICASALFPTLEAQWISVAPAAMCTALTYNAIITLYTELANEKHQGLMMGISGAVYAGSWAITGLSAALMNYFNPRIPAFIASSVMLFAFLYLIQNYKKLHNTSS